jgi:hypothetical protein
VSETATGKSMDMQSVYDALYPFAQKFSKAWEESVELISKFTDLNSGLMYSLTFPKDFKLKSVAELMDDLKRAREAEASSEVIRRVQDDILQIMTADDPLAYTRYQVREMYNPFSGMSEAERVAAVSSELVTQRDKVLYANLGNIFDRLESQYADNGLNFYELDKARQRQAVDTAVDEIMLQIANTQQPMFGGN